MPSMSMREAAPGSYTSVPANESADALRSEYAAPPPRQQRSSRLRWILLALAALLVLAIGLGVGLGVGLTRNSDSSTRTASNRAAQGDIVSSAAAPASSSSTPVNVVVPTGPTTGGAGSTLTFDDGTTAVYNNSFGGTWDATPFSNTARAQDDVPALNGSWDFSRNIIRGVNLGGWLVLEPFIVPAIFQRFNGTAVDEWTLSQALDNVSSTEKATVYEQHYSTFYTERDFAQIAGAGINYVRMQVPYWAMQTEAWPGEPFPFGLAFKHMVNGIAWARKYGLRVNLDVHGAPGSQNGWDHSGRRTLQINFMKGPMGIANAQRHMNYIRTLVEFISQPEYKPVVTMLGFLNEPMMALSESGTGQAPYQSFYAEMYKQIRNITGLGAGNGPMLALGDGFIGAQSWYGYLAGADRLALDRHSYIAFNTPQTALSISEYQTQACAYGAQYAGTLSNFGMNTAGECSIAVNDCSGYALRGVNYGSSFEGTYPTGRQGAGTRVGSCTPYLDYANFSNDTKQAYQGLFRAWQDATRNWFYWTWKIGAGTDGTIPNPIWSFSLGLQQGWIPTDLRNGWQGYCQSTLSTDGNSWNDTLNAAQTGGAGAGTGAALSASLASYPWPPALLSTGSTTYTYTRTAPVTSITAAPVVFGQSTITAGASGWANPSDATASFYAPVSGVSYPDAWRAVGSVNAPAATARP